MTRSVRKIFRTDTTVGAASRAVSFPKSHGLGRDIREGPAYGLVPAMLALSGVPVDGRRGRGAALLRTYPIVGSWCAVFGVFNPDIANSVVFIVLTAVLIWVRLRRWRRITLHPSS
ncbi:hypothetical protein JOE11_001253 [Robbsia andropogonis]|uniref:hypothetical protein n=1 Tax=Robbsia andropogonis TaxID=28092 RepID=UPI003D225E74